jgi:hypothetical protein
VVFFRIEAVRHLHAIRMHGHTGDEVVNQALHGLAVVFGLTAR